MDWGLFLRGAVIGFAIAAPVGPIGMLCIRRTLAGGRGAGLARGLGAAVADTLYGAVAAFGISAISSFLVGHRLWLQMLGGIVLLAMGVRTFLVCPIKEAKEAKNSSRLADFVSTFLLTLANPTTILSFAAVFAGFGLHNAPDDFSKGVAMVAGVFTGSALWWMLLSGSVGFMHGRFGVEQMRWVNRVSGVIIAGFGLLVLLSLGQ
jgi:threonine/homoserine/homoserine lactone efflux protein